MKKRKGRVVFIIICLLIIIIIAPYIKVEYLTWQHGSEFNSLYQETHMIDGIEYLKVFDYSDIFARVFYVGTDHFVTYLLTFKKQDTRWELATWEAVWSKYGSADSLIWPYYR